MNQNPLHQLSLWFVQRAEAAIQVGLKTETYCLQQLNREGDVSPGWYQSAMVSFSCAIESAAKAIVANDCPPNVFCLSGKGSLSRDALRDLWNPDMSKADLTRLLLNHYVLSFEDTLKWAKTVQPSLKYPVDLKILTAARNQAIHSLVLDEGWEVSLVAVTAIYMLEFLEIHAIGPPIYTLRTEEKERLRYFLEERGAAAESAHKKLQEIRSKHLLCEAPLKYGDTHDTDDFVHVNCPLCGVRARIVVDSARNWLEPGSIFLFEPGSTRLHCIYPKHFSCPGCKLELSGREVSESGLIFTPSPPSGASWQVDNEPLDEEELLEMYRAEEDYNRKYSL